MDRIPGMVVLVLCAACQTEGVRGPELGSGAGGMSGGAPSGIPGGTFSNQAGALTGETGGGEAQVGGSPADSGGHSAQGGSSGAAGTYAAGGASAASAGAGATAGASAASAGAGGSGEPGEAELTLEQAREDYTGWHRFTEQPVGISIEILGLCRLPSAAEEEFNESVHGDRLYLLDWLNDAAREGLAHKETAPFPAGAAIVKEKLRRDAGGMSLVALGIMIKREPGFDPEHGDWEYAYWQPDEAMLSGDEAATYCGGCHATSPTDFVFLDQRWRLPRRE